MTDPTTPTTFPVAKSLLARLERYAPPDECGGWHEWLDAVIEEARDGYVPASLSPEWHAELNLVAAEAAASALLALRAEVEGMGDPWAQSDGRPDKVSVARVLAAIDRIAKAEPEPKCEHGVPVALACRACRDAKAKPEGESRG